MDRFGDKVLCNPTVKLLKDKEYTLVDIEKITPGLKYVESPELVNYSSQSGAKFENGDVLMARITPCLENGKIAIANLNGDKGIGSTELFVFRGKEGVTDTDYVFYLLCMPYFRQMAVNSMTGASGRQRADIEFIKKIKWEFPEIGYQKKIVKILSAYDNLILNNKKRMNLLEQYSEELFKEWFKRFRFPGYKNWKFDEGLPEGWDIKRVKLIVDRLGFGTLYKEEDTEPTGKVIVIDQSQSKFVGFHNNDPSHVASVDKPIALFGDHSCKYQLMITPFSLSENVIPYVAKGDDIDTTYLFYALRGLVETTEYKRHWSELMVKKIFVPPFDLQKAFTNKVKPNLLMIQKLDEENRNLIQQRDMLLSKLLSGAIKVGEVK